MAKELIWYLCDEIDDNHQPEIILSSDLRSEYTKLGFHIHTPANGEKLLSVLRSLPRTDTILHICAHGDGTRIAPFTGEMFAQFHLDGFESDPSLFIVNYNQIQESLNGIYPVFELIINMMAICESAAQTPIDSNVFLGTVLPNDDFRESFEIYNTPGDDYTQRVQALNARRNEIIYTVNGNA